MTTLLPITNVINVSVSQASQGIGAYNTSNVALFTTETPVQSTVTLTFSDVAVSGTFVLKFGSLTVAAINWNDTAGQIQTKIQAVPALANITVTGSIASQTVILSQPYPFGEIPGPVAVPALTQLLLSAVSVTVGAVDANNKTLTYSTTPTAGGYNLVLGAFTAAIVFSDNAAAIQVKVRALDASLAAAVVTGGPTVFNVNNVPMPATSIAANTLTYPMVSVVPLVTSTGWSGGALPYAIYLEPTSVGRDFGTTGSVTYDMASALFAQQPNILINGGYLVVIPLNGATLDAAILTSSTQIQYFGIISTQIESQVNMLAAALRVQSLNKIALFPQYDPATIAPGGQLDLLRTGSYTQNRGLFYDDSTVVNGIAGYNALLYAAAYAGRGFSTNFSGSNTTSTMHLKQLATIQPDPNLTQTLLNAAQLAGADCYPSLQGVSSVFTSGKNSYFDQVYNLQWFIGAILVAGFNYLAQSSTKVPQTEAGMDGLKGAYRQVCQQAVSNQYSAPGTWTSPDIFGNQASFLSNITQYGYYIFSTPISQQAATARQARQAPLVQIAVKEAGAIQSSNVLVFVNA